MENHQISLDFFKYRNELFDQKVEKIIDSMTGNANFPEPTPDLTLLSSTLTSFRKAIVKAQYGTPKDKTDRNELRKTLESLVRELSNYIALTSKNDLAKIQSSSFELKKSRTIRGILDKPQYLRVIASKLIGAVEVKLPTVPGAYMYQYEYTEAPLTDESRWISIINTKSRLRIKDLVSGKKYYFRVKAMGSNPNHVYSDIVSSFVL